MGKDHTLKAEQQEPVAWVYTINKSHSVFSVEKPPEDAYDEGTLFPLYAAPPDLVSENEFMQGKYEEMMEEWLPQKQRIAELEARLEEERSIWDEKFQKGAERIATLTAALEKARDALDKARELLKYDLNVVEAISVIDEALK